MKKIISAIMCVSLFMLSGCSETVELPEEPVSYEIPVSIGGAQAENDSFLLTVSEEGRLTVTNKSTGDIYTSIPAEAETDEIAQGANKNRLMSEFLVTLVKSDGGQAELNSFESSLGKDGISVEKIGDSIRVWYNYPDQNVAHSVEYALESDGFTAAVSYGDLKEQYGKIQGDDWGFMSISLLPYFGASDSESGGYMIVPDGSGAIINHNNRKSSYATYAQELYGRDPSLNLEVKTSEEKTAPFPVYGNVEGSKGWEAIIENGDAEAVIYAETSGVNSSYNNVYAGFKVRRADNVSREITNGYGGNGTLGHTAVSAHVPENGEIKVKYVLVNDADLSYVTLAGIYGRYLESKGIEPKNDGAPLYLGVTGGISDTAYTLGIPHKTVVPITDFARSTEIINDLKSNGAGEIALRYSGWQKGGMNTEIPGGFKTERKLGGDKGFEALKSTGALVFPEVDLLKFYKGGNGFNLQSDSIFALSGSAAYVYDYMVNTGEKNLDEEPCRMLNPNMAAKAAEKLGETEFISLGEMGKTLPSEFNSKNPLTRQETAEIYGNIARKSGKVMAEGGNSYMLKGVSHIYGLESDSTGYDLEDGAIPFYQSAIHGLRSYSVTPINLTADTNRAMLKALETGSSLCYSVSGGDISEISGAAPYSYLRDLIIEQVNKAMPVIESVAGEKIVNHERIGEDVYVTTFENGSKIYVNYSDRPFDMNGKFIEAEGFLFEEGRA